LSLIYKLLDAPAWEAARAAGVFTGSAVDLKDGFIHFSNGAQAQETARLYFKDVSELVLLTIEAASLGDALKWEASRGGALFPHLYADLPLDAVLEARSVPLDAAGVPMLGTLP
jgi:uncharacterized protein (DUF952 family)